MAVRSIKYNHLADRIHMIHGDIKEMPQTTRLWINMMSSHAIRLIFTTPSKREINENEHLAIARHEILCTLDDAVRASSQFVRQGGKVAFVHRQVG